MPLVDTHAHLADERFQEELPALIERARAVGVEQLITIGTTADDSEACVAIAAAYPNVFASIGIHPNNAAEAGPRDWDRILRLCEEQSGPRSLTSGHEPLASSPQPQAPSLKPEIQGANVPRSPRLIVALGETGLDKHWDRTPFDLQQDYFDRHLRLSQQTGLPVVIHTRDCLDDAIVMLRAARERGPITGVMHSYTGDGQRAAECVSLGLYISFAGMVTFKKSDDLRAVAASIPIDRILVETDSPYLAPEPFRGRRNEPAHVIHTAQCIADVRGMPPDDFATLTSNNARRLFNLPDTR